MYTYNKNSHKSSGFCECENRSLLRMDPSAVERGNLTRVQPARGGQSSEMAAALCRRKMRMSGLCKVEMSAFIDGRGPYGNGANHLEPTRTGPIESVARGEAEASFAGSSSGAVEGNRPPGAANAAADSRTWGWCPGSRTAGQAIEPQGSSAVGAEDSGAPTPALCGFRTHAGCRTPGQGRSLGES